MSGLKTYDPSNVQIIMGGHAVTGYADGTFIDISPDEQRYNKTTGADGETSRSRTNNRAKTVTITLKQTSVSNDFFSGLAAADDLNNAGAVPFAIKEIGTGRTLGFAQAAWIENDPNLTYSKDVEDRAWTIATSGMDLLIGGNSNDGQSEA